MLKKIIVVLSLLIIINSLIYAGEKPSENRIHRPDIAISMKLNDYRMFLNTHPPLDRLYCIGDTCFFLVSSGELESINNSGIEIQSRENLLNLPPGHSQNSKQQGDINGPFHNYNETNSLLRQMEARYPSLAQVTTIGYSVEGRELNVIKISDNVNSEEIEPNIFIVGCHHAREWISVEVPLLFSQYLLEHYQDNQEVRRAVDGAQIYIVPLINPDGLEFSIHTYRMWRKNRRNNGNLSWGVDLNRNYGFMWGYDDEGSSPNPYSDVYRGPEPFSEPETETVRQFLLSHPPMGTLSYHSYGELIIYPWGYTHNPAQDTAEMDQIAAEMSERIYQVNGRLYTYGAADILYLTNGDTLDWIYGTFGTPAFTVELPPEYLELGGFFTSIEMIDSTFSENLPAMLYFINYFVTGEEDNYLISPDTGNLTLSPKRLN